jgi:hypothetical protein
MQFGEECALVWMLHLTLAIHTVHHVCVPLNRLDELRLSRQWLTDDSFTVTKQVRAH